MLSQCRRALDLSAGQRPKTFVNRTGARIARRSYSNEQKKRALIMDANGISAYLWLTTSTLLHIFSSPIVAFSLYGFGSARLKPKRCKTSIMRSDIWILTIITTYHVVYKRNEKKIAALTRYLAETGRYDMFNLDLESLTSAAEKLEHMRIEANTGVVTSHHYYMTLLLSLPLQPVDISGAISAITDAEYNITLFPDIHEALRMLKDNHGVKLGIVTDSMTPTPEKRNWIEKAGLNTEMYVY